MTSDWDRLAVELNLNKPSSEPPADERHERELLNRRRTWMICCIMDYSTSMQMGKQPTIREDEVRWLSALPACYMHATVHCTYTRVDLCRSYGTARAGAPRRRSSTRSMRISLPSSSFSAS